MFLICPTDALNYGEIQSHPQRISAIALNILHIQEKEYAQLICKQLI